jgi:hypothetical protein
LNVTFAAGMALILLRCETPKGYNNQQVRLIRPHRSTHQLLSTFCKSYLFHQLSKTGNKLRGNIAEQRKANSRAIPVANLPSTNFFHVTFVTFTHFTGIFIVTDIVVDVALVFDYI